MNKHQLEDYDAVFCKNSKEWAEIVGLSEKFEIKLGRLEFFKDMPTFYYYGGYLSSISVDDMTDTSSLFLKKIKKFDFEIFKKKLKGEYIEELEVGKVYENRDDYRVLILAKLNRKNQQFIGIDLLDFEYFKFESSGFYFSENEESEHDLIRLSINQLHDDIDLTRGNKMASLGACFEELEIGKVYSNRDNYRVLIIAKLGTDNPIFMGVNLKDFELIDFEPNGFYYCNNEKSDYDLIRLSPDQSHSIKLTSTKTNQE